jgi:hypothetical protein
LGRFRPNSPPYASPPSGPRGPFPQRDRPRWRRAPSPAASPAPPDSHSHPRSLSLKSGLVNAFLAPVTGLATRSPPATARPVASPLSRSPARFGALRLPELSRRPVCSSHPIATTVHHHPRRVKLVGARHLSPPSPPRAPIKGPPKLPPSPHRPRPLSLPSPELN